MSRGPCPVGLVLRGDQSGLTRVHSEEVGPGPGPLVGAGSEFSEGVRRGLRAGVVAGRGQGPRGRPRGCGWALRCGLCGVVCRTEESGRRGCGQRCAPFSRSHAGSIDPPLPDGGAETEAGRGLLPSRVCVCVRRPPWSLPCGEKPADTRGDRMSDREAGPGSLRSGGSVGALLKKMDGGPERGLPGALGTGVHPL